GATVSDDPIPVFFENRFFEVSKTTGAIMSAGPPEGLIWIANGLAIYRHHGGMRAIEMGTGLVVWTANSQPFTIRAQPVDAGPRHLLVVPQGTESACMLDLESGVYLWCYEGGLESDIAIDPVASRGYLVDNAFQLNVLDLGTGRSTPIASFRLNRPATPGELPPSLTGIAAYDNNVYVHFTTTNQLIALTLAEDRATPSEP
ncbi:MAG: hypothetical protein NTU91_10980, partial [Chloroflexi bacterium]|nr:hypothetical protein [Chloroflexota bacterium]